VDEATWLACNEPEPLLESLRPTPSERKLLLFGCGCYRLVWASTEDCFRRTIEVSERYADGLATFAELQATYAAEGWPGVPFTQYRLENAVSDAIDTRETSANPSETIVAQAALVRDLVGNPFRPVMVDSSWLTPNVLALARVIYDERRFEECPVLADALEDAGCNSEEILQHLRRQGQAHSCGCFVLDHLLNKD
jgi:hypothetical protein